VLQGVVRKNKEKFKGGSGYDRGGVKAKQRIGNKKGAWVKNKKRKKSMMGKTSWFLVSMAKNQLGYS